MIRGLRTDTYSDFLGKNTSLNLTEMPPQYLLTAKNVVIEGDGQVRTRQGYTLVKTLSGKIQRQFYFQRDSDLSRFVLVHRGSNLTSIPASGGGEVVLKAGESATSTFDFTNNYFAAYAGDGNHAYKIVDVAGTMTAYQHGITAPSSAPTIATGAGTLSLTYGRQAVMCFVSYITDSTGVRRMHISAPSPITAHTGPLTSKVITYGSLAVSTDPQVTHKWIFETMDSPLNSTSAFYFSGEITNATTSYGSSLADSALDTTRLAPFDNFAAPLGAIYGTYQNRVVIASGNTVYVSGFEEISLGIPQDAFPASLFFQLPEAITAVRAIDEGQTLMVASLEGWYLIKGYNAQTFTKRDRIISPGCIGKKAVVVTPTHMVWLSPDKKIYAWDGNAAPIEISAMISKPLAGTLTMQDLKDSQLANAELKWYSFGRHNYLILAANTSDQQTTGFNWLAMWYVDVKDGAIKSIVQSDFLPNDLLASIEVVKISGTNWLYLGDASTGNIYRWPDGYQDNGTAYISSWTPAWSKCGSLATKRMFFMDVLGNRSDMAKIGANAVVADAPMTSKTPVGLEVSALFSSYGSDGNVARANLQAQGVSIGKWIKPTITFPSDNNETVVSSVIVSSKPLYLQAP